MSSTLLWRPAISQEGKSLPYELKRVISRRLWDTDGTIGDGTALVSNCDIPYLEGLRDSGIEGAAELIKLIAKHGEIVLWHEH